MFLKYNEYIEFIKDDIRFIGYATFEVNSYSFNNEQILEVEIIEI